MRRGRDLRRKPVTFKENGLHPIQKAPKLSAGGKRGRCSSASDLRNKAAKLHYQPAQHRKLRLTPVHPEVLFDAGRNLTEEPDTEQQASPAAASLPEDTDEDCVTQVNSTTPVASGQTAENKTSE